MKKDKNMKKSEELLKNNTKKKELCKDNMIKYRCEKCDSILFEGSNDISGTIKIICKAKVSGNGANHSRKCKYINLIKGGKNV